MCTYVRIVANICANVKSLFQIFVLFLKPCVQIRVILSDLSKTKYFLSFHGYYRRQPKKYKGKKMFTININQECGCFKRSPYENNKNYESKDDALLQAQLMVNHMNTKFCQKHEFELSENGSNFIIITSARKQASSGCCGGGHCS